MLMPTVAGSPISLACSMAACRFRRSAVEVGIFLETETSCFADSARALLGVEATATGVASAASWAGFVVSSATAVSQPSQNSPTVTNGKVAIPRVFIRRVFKQPAPFQYLFCPAATVSAIELERPCMVDQESLPPQRLR